MVISTGHTALDTAGTAVAERSVVTTDPVVGAFLRNLRKERAPVSEVYVCLEGPYLIYTVVDSKSSAALDKVYRAEAQTQRRFWGPAPHEKVALVFEHRNRALGGQDLEDDFLSRGRFDPVW